MNTDKNTQYTNVNLHQFSQHKAPGYFDNDTSVYFVNCYYTNSQSSINNMDEFKAIVLEYKPKNYRHYRDMGECRNYRWLL